MEQNVTIVDPALYGIEISKATGIEKSFQPKKVEIDAYAEQYNQIIIKELNKETYKDARELRLKLVKARTGVAAVHKTEKEFFLASGKYVDALKNKLTLPIEQMEEKLLEIEKHEEKIESERKAKLKADREEAFLPYGFDTSFLPLAEMSEEQFAGQLESAKLAFETKKRQAEEAEAARIEAEKKAEAARLEREQAEAEERERIRLENEQLKREAQERQRVENERLAAEKKEREANEAKLAEERRVAEEARRQEEEKRIFAEKALREKEEEEARKKQEEEQALQAELNKGDSEKVIDLKADLEVLKNKYEFKSAKNKKMYADVSILLDKIIENINK